MVLLHTTFDCYLLLLQGFAGSPPAPNQLLSALRQYDLFLYFGHGAAQQYLSRPALRGLERCAASLLMGCSSGRLRAAGVYEPHGPVWDYLMAGEPRQYDCTGVWFAVVVPASRW
jgi:separase